jgi:hypothetical protein
MATSLIDRARAYVAKMPAAVSGSNGHGATFDVARVLLHFFELSREDAAKVLDEYNGRCSPAWSAKELKHKLDSAAKSKWEGPRARDQERSRGGEPGRAPARKGPETRTPRIGFAQCVPAATRTEGQSRTLRTDFLQKFNMCAQAQAHDTETASAKNVSEVSEPIPAPAPRPEAGPEKRNETQPDQADGLEGIQWKAARLEPGHDFRTKFTRWVGADGSIHHAHVSVDETTGERRIRIGRMIDKLEDRA